MQELTKNVESIKKICSDLINLEHTLNKMAVPFCILRLVTSNGVANDIKISFSNKAFRTSVNSDAVDGQSIKSISPKTVAYWLGPLEAVAKTKSEIIFNNYTVADGHVTYSDVTVFPIQVLGNELFGMVLEHPTYNIGELCLKCPNNPTVTNPSLNMVAVTVEDSGYSVCEICQTVRSLPSPKL